MKLKDLHKKKIPNTPGVYFFRDNRKKILYIGRATSLRSRVQSYFSGNILKSRSILIKEMIDKTKSIDFIESDSVLEAFILEPNLIKKHKPYYNSKEKDDKSFNYVVITKETFPRVLVIRGKELNQKFKQSEIKYIFGPFPQGNLLKEALKIIRKIFPFFDTKRPVSKLNTKNLNFNRQIGLFPEKDITKEQYIKTIRNIKFLFSGKKNALIRKLEHEMKSYAKEKKFEKAGDLKRKIFALKHIQEVSLIGSEFKKSYSSTGEALKRIEAYDISHFGGKDTVGVMTVLKRGMISKKDYRKFKIKSTKTVNDTEHLKEIISRRLEHDEWDMPQLIVIDGGIAQKNAVNRILKYFGIEIPVVSVVKDERHKPKKILGDKRFKIKNEKEILLANSEAHRFAISFHRSLRRKL